MKNKIHTLTSPIGCRLAFFSRTIFFQLTCLCLALHYSLHLPFPLGCSVLQWGSVLALPAGTAEPPGTAPPRKGSRRASSSQNTAAGLNKVLTEQWHLLRPHMKGVTDIKSYNRYICKNCIYVYICLPW